MKKKIKNFYFKFRLTLCLFIALFLFPKRIFNALKNGSIKRFNNVINSVMRNKGGE